MAPGAGKACFCVPKGIVANPVVDAKGEPGVGRARVAELPLHRFAFAREPFVFLAPRGFGVSEGPRVVGVGDVLARRPDFREQSAALAARRGDLAPEFLEAHRVEPERGVEARRAGVESAGRAKRQ